MSIFAVFDVLRDEDVSEHDRLCDAYREIDRLHRSYGARPAAGSERFSVRLARVHRNALQPRPGDAGRQAGGRG